MIMLQEGFSVEVVEMPHVIPESIKLVMLIPRASRIGLEGDVNHAANSLRSKEILPIGVGFVGGDFVDAECLGCLIHQSWELDIVSRLIRGSPLSSTLL